MTERQRWTPAPRTHSGGVLVVEDDELVGHALALSLRHAGFEASVARSMAEALSTFDAASIDVVVTDVVMPEFSGIELAQELAVRRPGLPLLLITGYVDGALALPPGVPVLFKPFLPRELCHRIAQLLAARPHSSTAS